MAKIWHTIFYLAAFLCVGTCGASEPSVPDTQIQKLETLYAKAYECYDRKEYVCAAYHFEKLLVYSDINSPEIERRVKIDNAYSLFFIDKMDVELKVGPIFNKKENLWRARKLLQEAQYLESFLSLSVNLELAYLEDSCSAFAKDLVKENIEILENKSGWIPEPELEGEVVEALAATVNEIQMELSGCDSNPP